MTYRELLEKCKTDPGCLGTREQKDLDAKIKYRAWSDSSRTESKKSNEEFWNTKKF